MSKHLKLKFKKILRKAEFVHADLEYHSELIIDAKQQFSAEVGRIIKGLSDEDKAKIKEIEVRQQKLYEKNIKEQANKKEDVETDASGIPENNCTDLAESDEQPEEGPVRDFGKSKPSDLKKIFHRIAALTHPDKVVLRGLPDAELERLEKIFKEATQAYEDNNWYSLYSIALSLGIDLDDPTQENIAWVEEDIRTITAAIAKIGNLVPWVWYNGDDKAKFLALNHYFQLTYGLRLNKV